MPTCWMRQSRRPGQVVGEVGDDLEQLVELVAAAARQVVGGEQVEGHHPDAEVVAPRQKLAELRGTGPVAVRRRLEHPRALPNGGCRR